MMQSTVLPPGVEGSFKCITSGGHPSTLDRDWMSFKDTKLYTNVFVWSESSGKILLGYKKRGFGKGLYNGFGGKVEARETPSEAAVRELKEESGLEAELTPCGSLLFYSEGTEFAFLIKVFTARTEECRGNPVETDEMRPEWFSVPPEYCTAPVLTRAEQYPPIPFNLMWPDDKLWMPFLLSRRPFFGRVDFAKLDENFNAAEMVKWWFGILE